jgi:N-acetylglucosaminyl-diphospho-decaprenol L-rhamnosyltransferase
VSAEVAVAIVSWNTRELLRACLESLRPDVESGLATIRVVDNGSEDGSPEMVAAEFGWAELIEPGENLGFGRAVNLAAERSSEPWIAPANADLVFEPGAVARLLEAGAAHPEAGALAPRLVMPDGRTQHSVHAFPRVRLGLALQSGATTVLPSLGDRLMIDGRWNSDRAREVEWVHGAFLIIRRAAFDRAGGFDPEQWMYAEDIDICWRLAKAGFPIRYEPSALVHHEVGAATRQAFAEDREQRHLTAAFDWMAKRQGLGRARAYSRINAIGSGLRAAALRIPAALAPDRFARAYGRHVAYSRLHRELARRAPVSPTTGSAGQNLR